MLFKVDVYLHDYAGIFDARRFQAMPGHRDICVVYGARHDAIRDMQVVVGLRDTRIEGAVAQIFNIITLCDFICHLYIFEKNVFTLSSLLKLWPDI